MDQPVLVEASEEEAFDLVDDGGLDKLVAGEEGTGAYEGGGDVLGLDLVLEPFGIGVISKVFAVLSAQQDASSADSGTEVDGDGCPMSGGG